MEYLSDYLPLSPLVSSAALAWQGLRVEQLHLEAGSLPAHHQTHHLLLLFQVEAPYAVQYRAGGQLSERVYQTGDLGLYPGGDSSPQLSWQAPSDNIFLSIDDQYLAQLGGPAYLARPALRRHLKFTDPLLQQLGRQLLAAASRPPAPLYVEALTSALGCHLLEHYAAPQPRPRAGRPLTSLVLGRIEAYVEAHAAQAVTLEALAGLANVSVFHFTRLFRQATGLSPYQYVLRWKIERARQLLRRGELSIPELSDALGFASPLSFAAAFKRLVGCTPHQYRRP